MLQKRKKTVAIVVEWQQCLELEWCHSDRSYSLDLGTDIDFYSRYNLNE